MKKTLFIIGLSAIFMAGCQNGAMQEREKQLQDSFASVMSAKNAELEVLLHAMEQADKNSFYMEDSLTSDYVVYTNLFQSLTKREKELADLFLINKTEEEIAQIMSITPRAVDNYMTRILSKLGVVTKKELLQKFGFQQGR